MRYCLYLFMSSLTLTVDPKKCSTNWLQMEELRDCLCFFLILESICNWWLMNFFFSLCFHFSPLQSIWFSWSFFNFVFSSHHFNRPRYGSFLLSPIWLISIWLLSSPSHFHNRSQSRSHSTPLLLTFTTSQMLIVIMKIYLLWCRIQNQYEHTWFIKLFHLEPSCNEP